jgi:hypothetical protein
VTTTRWHGWDGWLATVAEVGLVTAALLPVAVLLAWALARSRAAAGVAPARARLRSVADVGLVYGTVPWVWLTMVPGSRAGLVPGRVSLVPLRDLVTMGTGQVVGNLLIFSALGFIAPLRWSALASVPRVVALGAGCSALVEVAQYVLRLDRVSSVDDVLLNATGAGVAALMSRCWWACGRRERDACTTTVGVRVGAG